MDARDQALVAARVKEGQVQEFSKLVQLHQAALFRIAANLVGPMQAEDLVQDAFTAAFKNIGRFDPDRGGFQTWLYRITRNLALNARKKKRAEPWPEGMEIVDARTPEDEARMREIFQGLDRVLDELGFQDRVIFVLAELEGLPQAEIARIEGLRLGTVKSRLARIKAKMRDKLKHYVD